MLPLTLPLVGFVTPIKKRWENGQEKKPRTLKIDPDKYFEEEFSQASLTNYDDDDDDDDDLSSFASSASSSSHRPRSRARDGGGEGGGSGSDSDADSDYSFLDDYAGFVQENLLPKDPIVGQEQPKLELTKVEVAKRDGLGFLDRQRARFEDWCAREVERRKHYIVRDYEEKVRQYESKLQAKLADEIEAMRREVVREAVKLQKLRKINSMHRPASKYEANKLAAARYDKLLVVRDAEKRRMDFFCNNLQAWAVEKHDQKIRDEELRLAAVKEAEQKEAERLRLERRAKAKLDDAAVLAEDIRITQEWRETARRVGALAGANVPVKLAVVAGQDL